jgi:protein-disulfide isomerase
MLSNRNSNSSGGCSWMTYLVVIALLGIAAFGGRHQIKSALNEYFVFDKDKVEEVIKEYIEKNPKAIIASLQKMQEREHEEMTKQAQMKIKEKKDELQGKGSAVIPFAGNKNGDVTIVAFLDYRCGYCKTSNNTLKELIEKDANVKVVFKELPVLGPQSQKISQMALAIYLIDDSKYMAFHNAVMNSNNIDDKALENILKQMNLDNAKVNEMMKDPRIAKELENVMILAQQLGVRGTPAFIIDETLIPGAIDLNGMQEMVKAARSKLKASGDAQKN